MSESTPLSVEVDSQIEIEAPAAAVWRALTEEIGEWWDRTFTDEPAGIYLEPKLGGHFYEDFDGKGAGALYAVVTYLDPPRKLRISGPMGMPGARQYVKTYELSPDGDSTVVSTNVSMLGDIDPERLERYRQGGEELLELLKKHVEANRN